MDRLLARILSIEGDVYVERCAGEFEEDAQDKTRRLGPGAMGPKRISSARAGL